MKASSLLAFGLVSVALRLNAEPRPGELRLPHVNLRNADMPTALRVLVEAAQAQGGAKVTFVLNLPKDFRPRYEITAELEAIPFSQALLCVGDLAGVEFTRQGSAIAVRVKQAAPVSAPALVVQAAAPAPARGLTGVLGKPAESATTQGGIHRALDGSVQPEQSGYIAHRALGGGPVAAGGK